MEPTVEDLTPPRLAALPTWQLGQVNMHAQRLVGEGLAELGSRRYHYRVLATLDELGPASHAALGRRSGIHLSDIVATVNELEDATLVERAPDPTDRRRNIITITPAGRRHLRKLERRLARVQEELLAPLSTAERAELSRLLRRVLAHHTPTADPPAPEYRERRDDRSRRRPP
jgi:DNA-binding MarR family transcriptional regulator